LGRGEITKEREREERRIENFDHCEKLKYFPSYIFHPGNAYDTYG
jgi:hypothetical protein